MAKLLQMPKLSPTMDEGVLAVWHKKVGDAFAVDDLLAEVETDKATMEFRAFDAGTLLDVLVGAGENVKLGQPVAIVGDPGEDFGALKATVAAPAKAAAAPAAAPVAAPSAASVAAPVAPAAAPAAAPATPVEAPRLEVFPTLTRTEYAPASAHGAALATNDRPLASPHVRQLAREASVDLSRVRGSGAHGRILPEDLARAATAPARGATLAAAPSGAAPSERTALTPMRRTIARRLSESKREVPHFYLRIDLDAAKLVAVREELVASLAAEAKGGDAPEKPSINDFVLCAVSRALVMVPECNASFDGDAILTHKRVDLSVAVAVADGLVTPVVRSASDLSLLAIHREVKRLAAKAKAKKLQPEEMTGGTFSVSNLGMFGVDEFAAVINPPEGAILAVGRVRDEPVVKGDAVVPGKRLAMTLSCDHRVIDGAVGARFLAALRTLLEHPVRLLAG